MILSDEDKKSFMELLNERRRMTADRFRMGVRMEGESVSFDALAALADMLEDSEALSVCFAEDVKLSSASFDYGSEVGVSATAHPKPHETLTLAICFKFLLAVVQEKQRTIDHQKGEHIKAREAIGEWAKLFASVTGIETEELPFMDPLIVSKEHHRGMESELSIYHAGMEDDE